MLFIRQSANWNAAVHVKAFKKREKKGKLIFYFKVWTPHGFYCMELVEYDILDLIDSSETMKLSDFNWGRML